MNKKLKMALGITVGAILGFGYYYFIGCRTGTCPISGNPFISTAYGGFIGFLVVWTPKKKQQSTPDNNG